MLTTDLRHHNFSLTDSAGLIKIKKTKFPLGLRRRSSLLHAVREIDIEGRKINSCHLQA